MNVVQYLSALSVLEERIHSIIASVLQQFNGGAITATVRYTFPISYTGAFFTNLKRIETMKPYYVQRAKVFMAKEEGYYVKGKYKALGISKTHRIALDDSFKWTVMSRSEKLLFMRVW